MSSTAMSSTSQMLKAEFSKIRIHRTPWMAGLFLLGTMLLPTGYFLVKPPAAASDYLDVVSAVFAISSVVAGAVFGGWLLGHEYRQGTLRRVATLDARRGRLLGQKAVAGLVSLTAIFAVSIVVAIGAAAGVAAVHGTSVVWTGVADTFLAGALYALVAAALAFGVSAVLRSDTYAMLSALALMLFFQPLLAFIPTVGKYTPGAAASAAADWIVGSPELVQSGGPALLATVGWLAVASAGGAALFARRDI